MLDIQYNKYDQLCKLCLDSLWKFLFHFPSLTCFFSRETSPGSSIHLSQSQDVSPPTHLHVCHWQSLQPEFFHRKNGKVGRSHRTKEPRFMGPKVQQIRWKIWTTTSRLTTITPCKNAMFNTSNAHSRKTSQWQMKASCEGVVECPKSGVILLLRWIKSPVNSSIPEHVANFWLLFFLAMGINWDQSARVCVLPGLKMSHREGERGWVYYSEGPERSLWSYWSLGKGWIIDSTLHLRTLENIKQTQTSAGRKYIWWKLQYYHHYYHHNHIIDIHRQ